MATKRKRSVELHDDMLFEILSWLPAKSICISKCCCKSFLHFTKSPNFALKQSHNWLLKHDSYFFIQDSLSRRKIEIHSSLPSYSSTSDQIPREKVGFTYSKFLDCVDGNDLKILASSNGLLLCRTLLTKGNGQLFICNPTTQSYSFIPSPVTHGSEHHCHFLVSFECNNIDGDHKLYALGNDYVQPRRGLVCKMYIPKEGVWKEREARFILGKNYSVYYQFPVFYKGAIHLPILELSRWRKYVASYNVESGVSRIFELPDGASERSEDEEVGIFKWGEVGSKKESICLVSLKGNSKVGYAFTVWVLSDHESSSGGNWSKILCGISLKEMVLDRMCYRVMGFIVLNGRSLVFATETEVYDYDLSGKRETRLEKVGDHELTSGVTLFPYSDTLRSCGIGSTTLGV